MHFIRVHLASFFCLILIFPEKRFFFNVVSQFANLKFLITQGDKLNSAAKANILEREVKRSALRTMQDVDFINNLIKTLTSLIRLVKWTSFLF